jgi:TolB protein
MDADGHDQKRLTFDNSLTQAPCWGQNGAEIYYTSHKDWNPDLFGLQLGAMKTWPISCFPKMNYAANWSPQRERIVLTLGKDGNSEIYTMDRSGNPKSLQRLTWTPGIDSSPCWNPAGNQIVFVSDRTGTPQVHIVHADGTGDRLLTRQGAYNQAPVWSPKGDLIAYSSRGEDGHHNICTIRLDGTDQRQLTRKQGNNEDPSWAPDGEHLVFASDRLRFSEFQIYIMRTDGSNQRPITDQSNNHSPAWSPGPASR